MAPFSKPASNTPLGVLPLEITIKIMNWATLNSRDNAASCRLVCQSFHGASSQFLIRTIVIAERLGALHKAHDVMYHPYFSQYVTHLLWDNSYYRVDYACDEQAYESAFSHLERVNLRSTHPGSVYEGTDLAKCRATELDYRQRFSDQTWIQGGEGKRDEFGFTEHRWMHLIRRSGDLAGHCFSKAINRLPRLRHIIFSDWRAMAQDGETDIMLCKRLFGDTIAPSWRLPYMDSFKGWRHFLYKLMNCPRSWHSLSIGRNPFDRADVDSIPHKYRVQDVMTMSLGLFLNIEGLPKLRVKSVELPMFSETKDRILEVDGAVSRIIGPELTTLNLHVDTFPSRLKNVAHLDPRDSVFQPMTDSLHVHFELLQNISLRGFAFSASHLERFLVNNANTLRTLRVVDCYCPDTYDYLLSLAERSIAPKLTLTGVEIYGLYFGESRKHIGITEDCHTIVYLNMRSKDGSWGSGDSDEPLAPTYWSTADLREQGDLMRMDMVSGWPYERHELENVMLGGRKNRITQRMVAVPNASERHWWYYYQSADG